MEPRKTASSDLKKPAEALGARSGVQPEHLDLADAAVDDGDTEQHDALAIIEMVFGTLGRLDLLPPDSLKALRLTNKACCDLVDAAGVLTTAIFSVGPWRNGSADLDALEVWARGGPWRRTRSLIIDARSSQLPSELADSVLATITAHRPPISKLKLYSAGSVGERLLAVPLDQLRELSLSEVFSSKALCENPSFSGLHSLCIDHMQLEASALVTTLSHFSELRGLELSFCHMKGASLEPDILKNSLHCLESLCLSDCRRIPKVGLPSAVGPALPSLRSLDLQRSKSHLEAQPWLNQLTMLNLSRPRVNFPSVAAALKGGPLKELRLFLTIDYSEHSEWDFSTLELPHVTRLDIGFHNGDVLGDVARAKMPLLRRVMVPIGQRTSVSGVCAFAAAFPCLRELMLLEDEGYPAQNEHYNGPPSPAVLEALGRHVLPLLESLEWKKFTNRPGAIQNLLPKGPVEGTPLLLRLRSLNLLLDSAVSPAPLPKDVFVALARAAPHFPFLEKFEVTVGDKTTQKTMEAFIAAASEVKAWHCLRSLAVDTGTAPRYRDYPGFFEKVYDVWPLVTTIRM